MQLASIPQGYWINDIYEEIWDSHIYDKLIPLKQGWTVVDIGASIGVFSIYAAQQVGGQGRVIAFEPETTSYEALLRNLAANDACNVEPVKMGVWSSSGTKTIQKNSGNLAASTMFTQTGEPVQVDTLTSILPKLGVSHVDFVKIDTEGAATEILKGCTNELLQNVDNFAVAAYHAPNEDPAEISRILRDAGFRTRILTRYGVSPFVYATRDPTINLAVVELWQVLAVAGISGLLIYGWSRR